MNGKLLNYNIMSKAVYRHIPISSLSGVELFEVSKKMKLSLSQEDMLSVQQIFKEEGREPTEVELEVIAQTWSEHCKHRIFNAEIEHELNGKKEVVDSLFKTYIRKVTERIMAKKPDFVLSAFEDNAGFVKLDENLAVCLKVETHNHPSAIEPYAGANTGLGGVIRDILGAGKGAKPVASMDVFCFGPPDIQFSDIKASDVIHPMGVMRGVVRGVRDYGNRMGIPTVNGAIQFDDTFIYNPLVFCGTAGVIPIKDIAKEVKPGHLLIAAGGRTGKDGLKGATFSSASLTTDSHEEDQTCVQIGNPIEEKKAADFVLAAREAGLIQFITDCGAGGFSSAAGEMLKDTGGEVWLEKAPLKEPGLESWQVFLSESQERMVMAIEEKDLPALQKLADTYQSEICVLAKATGKGRLTVYHYGEVVCDLPVEKLHEAPRRKMKSRWQEGDAVSSKAQRKASLKKDTKNDKVLEALLTDFAICSREPIIREYDHEVQGNTLLKPLAGASGDAPQDGSVIQVHQSAKAMTLACALLPEWGKTDPYEMGRACVDECVRQLVAMGSDPERIAILDNFCLGNPDDHKELGALVECVKGMAKTAEFYGAPFVSGKDSFYNYFITDEGSVSIPCTLVVSGFGIIDTPNQKVGSSIRKVGSQMYILGKTSPGLRGSVYNRLAQIESTSAPQWCDEEAWLNYQNYYQLVKAGAVLSCHDLSEGGLAVAAAEQCFSMKAGMSIDVSLIPRESECSDLELLYGETPGRLLLEVAPEYAEMVERAGGVRVGETTAGLHLEIINSKNNNLSRDLIQSNLLTLKRLWKERLKPYY
jgi:phosphoribosylformylglycinamidine synthase